MRPEAGQKAPFFEAKDQNGNVVKLSDYLGSKVVLYFYPKDDTPGCTEQACNLRDNMDQLSAAGYKVIGVSADDEKSHAKFSNKHHLNFTLVADVEKKIVEDYGVWVEKSMYGKKYFGIARTTFLIDESGIITKVIEKVKTKEHVSQII
ncbi:MAG: thioredoxin-dependent thiol peroxidase [Cytophagales bacterium]